MNAVVKDQHRLFELEVENFQRVTLVNFAVKRGITELAGPNGAGKSSVIDAIAVWLDGLKVASDEPIHNGAQRARIRGRLGEMYVTRTISRDKKGAYTTEIKFEPVGGKAYPATQRQLSDLIGEHNLDPMDFVKLDTKGKFDALRAFVPGFDFLKASQDHAADFSRRTDVNRLAREASAAAALISIPNGTPAEPIDEAALVAELQEAGRFNTELETRRARRAQVSTDMESHRTAAQKSLAGIPEVRPAALAVHAGWVAAQEAAIAELEQQIARIRARVATGLDQTEQQITAAETELRTAAETSAAEADRLEKLLADAGELPQPKDADAVSQRISQARETNANVARAEQRAKHLSTAARYQTEADELTAGMDAREAAKQKAIAEAKIPVPGIEFGEGTIRYNGSPFEQASMAQKLRVGFARICALNPKLPFAWIRDASLLDDESYAEVGRLSAEYQVDVLIETVRPIGGDAIVLQDGRRREAKPVAVEESAA